MRRLLDTYRVSPLVGPMLLILTAAVLVLMLGPRRDEAPAFVVIAVVLTLLVVGSSPVGLARRRFQGGYIRGRSTGVRDGEQDVGAASFSDSADPRVEEEAWQHERARRAARREETAGR